jgi:FMN phosphatase YigB (HAD superfamily)
MDSTKYIEDYDAFFFELDNVLYPEKDYLLQVYYLFAQFIEYGEQIDGQGIIRYMEKTYLEEGAEGIFEKTAKQFGLDNKYKVNFDLLQQNARLPLKLLLFAPVLKLMQGIIESGKKLFLLTEGDPLTQLNKIKQLEWNGVEQHLMVYFAEELSSGRISEALDQVMQHHQLKADQSLMIGEGNRHQNITLSSQIKFLPIGKLLVS